MKKETTPRKAAISGIDAKAFRLITGKSQKDWADMVGVAPGTVSAIERGSLVCSQVIANAMRYSSARCVLAGEIDKGLLMVTSQEGTNLSDIVQRAVEKALK